jgi:hypothetical protein
MIAGRVSINYTDYETKPFDQFYRVFLREVIHALGFHSQAYPYWKQPGTETSYPDEKPYVWRNGVSYLNTPSVVYLMKEFYDMTDDEVESVGGGFPMEEHGCKLQPGFLWSFKYAPYDINTSGTIENTD